MTWGVESQVVERFAAAGVPTDQVSCVRDTFTFNSASSPVAFVDDFRKYYGPTMNAFDAAGQKGRASDLRRELETLFEQHNESPNTNATRISAAFLRVTVVV
jgi:hypothetical protein